MDTARTAGIIAEYNPFHNGHSWMIRQLRERGFTTIVCVMSGPFVQRGEAALLPSSLRAELAVKGGADLVFRLPVGGATASAEGFGAAGVRLLHALGCVDTLAFGAETPDTEALTALAGALLGEDFPSLLKKHLSEGISFPAARARAAEELLPGADAGRILQSPNNILGIEYCKASLRMQRAGLHPPELLALPRRGAAHDGWPGGIPTEADDPAIASAGYLRELFRKEGMAALLPYLPDACRQTCMAAEETGRVLSDERMETALLSRLRQLDVEDFNRYPAANEGLGARLFAACRSQTTLEGMFFEAKSKRFTLSRVRRLALHAALGLEPYPEDPVPFLHLLAANPAGLALLKKAKQRAHLPLSASLATLANTSAAAAAAAEQEAAAEDLYSLCLCQPTGGGKAYTKKVRIIREAPPAE